MAVPTLLRPQHKLGDFFFQSDMEKLHGNNFPGAMSGNINTMNVTMMRSNYYSGDNYYYTSPVTPASSPYSGKIMNVNYAYNVHNNSGEIVDNAEKSFSLEKAAKSSERKESKKKYVETRRKKYGKKKPEPIVEDVVMTEVEDRVKESNLQTEITREQEYQDMINMLYNNPELWEQHHQSLQHQPALHQCDSEMDQHVMKHNAPMYFITHQHDLQFHHDQHQHVIQQQQPQQLHQLHHSLEQEFHHDQPQLALQHQHVIQQHQPQQLHHSQGLEKEFHHDQPLKTSTPTAMFLSETSSDYFSDSNPSSECPSDDESSSEVLRSSLIQSPASEPRWPSSGKFNFYDTALSWAWESEEPYSAPLELDEELNTLVLSIISE